MAKQKHRFIQTHRSHKLLISMIYGVLIFLGYHLWTRTQLINPLDEASFRMATVYLLFSLNIVVMIFILIVTTFMLELKEKYFD